MSDPLLHIANIFFYTLHTILIFFNLFGWLYRPTRQLNLISLLLTFASWFLLGLWKGWGYCFLTDWHYQILYALGERNMPSSYITFLLEKMTGWSPSEQWMDALTLGFALLALLCSIWSNWRDKALDKNR